MQVQKIVANFFFMGNLEISITNRRQMDYILSTRMLNKDGSFLQPSHKVFNIV